MYDVRVKYGVRVEYDGSVEYDVVVVCTKRTKDKEKRYLKITARIITYIIPLYNRLVLITQALPEISDLREPLCFVNFPKPQHYPLPFLQTRPESPNYRVPTCVVFP